MLTIEIKVNGSPIVVVDAHRGREKTGPNEVLRKHDYPYRAMVFPIDMDHAPLAACGTVTDHKYNDGIVALAARILEHIAKGG